MFSISLVRNPCGARPISGVAVWVRTGVELVLTILFSLFLLCVLTRLATRACFAERRSVSAEEPVPAELQAPLAVAQHLLEAPTSAPEPSGAPEVEAKENGIAPADSKEEATENVSDVRFLLK